MGHNQILKIWSDVATICLLSVWSGLRFLLFQELQALKRHPFVPLERTLFVSLDPLHGFSISRISRSGNNTSWLQTAVHELGIETIVFYNAQGNLLQVRCVA